ncbi:PadR family transcriptional regulator [Paenibacillus larvae]|nr:PadR family transcriptional regulator [Paenibacillus larvae]AQR78721.1 hypothetical protein BXP28_17060 [Paenibacillus larvae subsp. larvae]ARF68364.1 hypothetical protein B7C51_11925 [Paenibacillus larvae subsp. pulvifaciens]AVF24248.1 transcriptional regulator PadR family-like protein [Paenibacillus larvae subsp. larvae]ETK29086.1 transcriptional regulator PadR family-like protein [Paenibacillus larvae subsp. larvae DSM 25719]MCY7488435.1 PadR family transcriptional regulator [Paenibacill
MDVEKEILKGYVETILLSLLYKKTYYRYEMQKEIKRLCNGKVEFKEAAVYIALKRLEKNGFASSAWDDSSSGNRRKQYGITDKGIGRLRDKIEEWEFFKKQIDLFLEGVK